MEPRLRGLLPADLYAEVWLDPSPANLMRVFEHLRTLQRILGDYISRQVLEVLPRPGEIRSEWQEGTLMFTDLAGFTPLMEVFSSKGGDGAKSLLGLLNAYFGGMIEIISKSGGNVLEFTGDAMLAQFSANRRSSEGAQAVRAGLRMQRAMSKLSIFEMDDGTKLSFGMRVGVHSGRFLTADIGTPRRMDHILLGNAVRKTKLAEGAGTVGRVCMTDVFTERLHNEYRYEPTKEDHRLVIDDLSDKELGEFDLSAFSRRISNSPLMDRSMEGLLISISEILQRVEAMASYLPTPTLQLLIENTTRREIPPDFPVATVVFVTLQGISEVADQIPEGREQELITSFSRVFTLINAAVESRGGFLKKVTYHMSGSDIMIVFGVPQSRTDDVVRAADAALAIRHIMETIKLPPIGDVELTTTGKIGIATGPVFSGEIGEPRGRREFNVLGDTVNTSARLMGKAAVNQILMTEAVYKQIEKQFDCESLGPLPLKGKSAATNVYSLKSHR
jgi:class 3 adenylate cyclase